MPIISNKKPNGGPVTAIGTKVKPQVKKPWFVRGDATAVEVAKEDQRIEEQMSQRGKLFRFWLPKGEEASITFVDGDLTEKGVLDSFMFREHSLNVAGKWGNNYVCTAEQEPCPICEGGDKPSLVGVLTVIDHREIVSKKGNPYTNTRKLFVAKRTTLKVLQKEATTRGGLAGCRFNVSRIAEQAASVGDAFSFIEKGDPKVLAKQYVREGLDPKTKQKTAICDFQVANYDEEIHYYTAAELRKLGFGTGSPIGGEGPVHGSKPASASVEEELG